MFPTVIKKDSLDFLSDYYFDTKSPVAFTSPLALYRDPKKRYPFLTFRQVKTWLQSKDTYTLHKSVRHNFPTNRVIFTGTGDQWQADLVDVSSLVRFNKGYNLLLTCIDVFSKSAWVLPLSLVNDFQSTWSSADPLKSYRLTKELNFSIVISKLT